MSEFIQLATRLLPGMNPKLHHDATRIPGLLPELAPISVVAMFSQAPQIAAPLGCGQRLDDGRHQGLVDVVDLVWSQADWNHLFDGNL